VIAPFVVELFNRSLAAGHFPACFKEAFITPVIKKAGLDASVVSSYRPISNLPVLSKLLERLAVKQLMDYLTTANLLPQLQSGFRPCHSTETAVLKVLSDILQAIDQGDVTALVLLDLPATFDTVDHDILLQRLSVTYGVSPRMAPVLPVMSVSVRPLRIKPFVNYLFGVWRSAGIGAGTTSLHRWPHLTDRKSRSVTSPHLYADDTQVYGFCRPVAVRELSASISECTAAVASWVRSNRLKLNADKTEVLWCTTGRRQHQLPSGTLMIDDTCRFCVVIRSDLAIHIHADLVMRTPALNFCAVRKMRGRPATQRLAWYGRPGTRHAWPGLTPAVGRRPAGPRKMGVYQTIAAVSLPDVFTRSRQKRAKK